MAESDARTALIAMFEHYVLDVIGHLPEEKRREYFDQAPEVAKHFNDWKDVIRFFFPNSEALEAEIRGMWKESQEATREEGSELTPEEFTRLVVEANFAPLVDRAARRHAEQSGERENGA
jgi:hypothetical protein